MLFQFSALTTFRTTQFIVGVNKYLEALKHEYAVGMRFKMQFEAEGNPDRR